MKNNILILALIVFLFLFLRFVNLSEAINFGSDAGRDFLAVWNIVETQHPTLIGPPSQYTIEGREFFFGPASYYVILPALLIGNWEPLVVSYFLILLNLVALLVSLLLINNAMKQKLVVVLFGLFCTITPEMITYAQSYWNPYLMLPISTLLVGLLVGAKKFRSGMFFITIGALFGLGLQFHYSFIFAIIVSLVWLIVIRRLSLHAAISITGGFVVGFLPVLLFELRNNFYNLNTLILVITDMKAIQNSNGFPTYYLISLLPFIFFLFACLLVQVRTRSNILFFFCLSLFVLLVAYGWMNFPSPQIRYPLLKQMVSIIQKDKPANFNIVDQATRDNRASALRYLLTVKGLEAKGATDYASPTTLYIYSKRPLTELLKNPVWEIKSFLPFKDVKVWELEDNFFLYRLNK